MQESAAVDGSLVNGHGTLSKDTVRSSTPDRASGGFTAVNGAHKRAALLRPNDAPAPLSASPAAEISFHAVPPGTQDHSHRWRPSDSNVNGGHVELEPGTGKRKRTDHLNRQSPDGRGQARSADAASSASPINRAVSSDSAADRTSLDHLNQPRALSPIDSDLSDVEHAGAYAREKSPVERWNKGEPPPKPRPETEASLAASLQQFQQQTQQGRDPSHSQSYSPRYLSPNEEREYMGESQVLSDDQYNGDVMDPKRRKRNFSNRTKTGCHTCRKRKKKCDEGKPTCQNCERGNFTCEGYCPKPPGFKMFNQTRTVIPLQSKTPMAPYNGRQTDTPSVRQEEGRSYSHWGRVPPPPPPPPPTIPLPLPAPSNLEPSRPHVLVAPADPRRPGSSVDNWHKSPYATPHDPQPPPYANDRLPPNFPPMPSLQPLYPYDQRQHPPPPPHMHIYPLPQQEPPPPPPHPPNRYHSSHSSSHPPPMRLEPRAPHPIATVYPQQHLPHSGPLPSGPPVGSSRGSGNSVSHRSDSFHLGYPSSYSLIEKDKMLRGQPFLHYLDPVLCQERQSCKAAVERYNKAAETTSGISDSERGKLFTQILKPHKRADAKPREVQHAAPDGSIGDHSIVEPSFKCEYGYNIHIGSKCIVESGCFFQDAADIFLGHRVVVGHNVKLYCRTVPLDPSARNKGSQSNVIAGAIKIEDDCFIGADVVVMPFVTIGRGAVVGAGSVVTKDVEENTVVAGNPAKLIRRIEGSNVGRHHSQQVQRQKEKMVDWMVRYANEGFRWYASPQL